MSHTVLLRLGYFVLILIVIVIIYILYTQFYGEKITEKQAILICAKVIDSEITKDFKIISTNYNSFFNLLESKIDLDVLYSNNKVASTSCIFKSKYKKNIVNINQTLIVSPSGKLIILNNLSVKLE